MDAGPPPGEIVRVLREHELALSSLYETFAGLLPDMAEFWRAIAAEEKAHAEVLTMLNDRVPSGAVRVNHAKFTFAGIESAIAFLAGRIARFRKEGVTATVALNTAIDAERSALEREFFALFASSDPGMLAEFEDLAVHTAEHLRRLEDERERRNTT